MKASYKWLQDYFEEPLPKPEELGDILTMHSFEIDSIADKGIDSILDIKVMPDRAHDCLSYSGLAREIGVLIGQDSKPLFFMAEGDPVLKTSDQIDLKVLDEKKCRRAMFRITIGVAIEPSPAWLKERLESVGQRSINNIVDITNFVMLETGQPVHAFDLDKIIGADNKKNISIRNAKAGEQIKTLDGKEFILDESILVISSDAGALDIAGVKGGAESGIDENTKNVLLSACNFDPINIRQTSKKLGLRTDASERFEKEISPALTEKAMDYLSFLVKEITGGYLAADVLDFYPEKQEAVKISLSLLDINRLIGIKMTESELESILEKLKFDFDKKESYEITPPIERLDLRIKEDLVEEIGRIYGYEKIPAILPSATNMTLETNQEFYNKNLAARDLLEKGYTEVYNYTFRNKGEVELANPIASDKKFMRANLSDGLKESIDLNIKNLPLLGIDEVKVFEIGTIFKNGHEETHIAFGDKKEIKEMLLSEYVKDLPKENFQQEVKFELSSSDKKYKSISIYPFILRDIAVWMPKESDPNELIDLIKRNSGTLLAAEPKLFDRFEKEGKVSYAYKLVFQSSEKTLSDEEINSIMAKINEEIVGRSWQVR